MPYLIEWSDKKSRTVETLNLGLLEIPRLIFEDFKYYSASRLLLGLSSVTCPPWANELIRKACRHRSGVLTSSVLCSVIPFPDFFALLTAFSSFPCCMVHFFMHEPHNTADRRTESSTYARQHPVDCDTTTLGRNTAPLIPLASSMSRLVSIVFCHAAS